MATHSSSEWSDAGGADVIDLDRFMLGVRPHRASQRQDTNLLIVDNGGLTRKPPPSSSSSETTPRGADPGRTNKRFSHDSGVSDGSYVRRRHKPHRRYSVAGGAGIKTKREAIAARPSGSSDSMRAFRVACQRALRDQQRQLARVALMCERLGERGERRERSETEQTGRTTKTDSSDLSSSSNSTRDSRRKDKNRAQECKTYKIIMTKLDELNRMFASRRAASASPKRRPPSSVAVSVSDKVVATGDSTWLTGKAIAPTQKVLTTKRIEADERHLVERAVGESPVERNERSERGELRSARLANLTAVNNAYALDIAPRDTLRKYPNIATESVVNCDSSNEGSRSTLCEFNLDDPVQLYAQAKRLQALHVTSARRTWTSDRSERYSRAGARAAGGAASGAAGKAAGVSLCALCREYWRAVRGYIAAQVCCPTDDLPSGCRDDTPHDKYEVFALGALVAVLSPRAGSRCLRLQKEAFVSSASLPGRLQASLLVTGTDYGHAGCHIHVTRSGEFMMWFVDLAWTMCLLLMQLMAVVRGCKKKTICRPPPGGKPGCGGRGR